MPETKTVKSAHEIETGDVIVHDDEQWLVKDNTVVYNEDYKQFVRVGRNANGVQLATGFIFDLGEHIEVVK